MTQEDQVVEALRRSSGYATLKRLYEEMDFSDWRTKTPEATVRRIVQKSDRIFRVRPGLWALEENRDLVLERFEIKKGDTASEERFTHGYYQGLLVEIGKLNQFTTYIPPQDKKRLFIDQYLGSISDLTKLPDFTYERILRKARTIDVVWLNKERMMPVGFFEVEHTTDIKNSLSKFYELQDFNARFFIVSDKSRESEFKDKLNVSLFSDIKDRVDFLSYDKVAGRYNSTLKIKEFLW